MENEQQGLSASQIRYLLAMYDRCDENGRIRSVTIATALGVTKPSVHTMMKTLKDAGWIRKDQYGSVSFTAQGMQLCEQYIRYYRLLCGYLAPLFPQGFDLSGPVCSLLTEFSPVQLEEMCQRIGRLKTAVPAE